MNMLRITGRIILYLLVLSSCKELYYPEGVDSTEKIPVILGQIEEGSLPIVKLSYASPYQSNERFPISGANVFISDNQGSSVELYEDSIGYYLPATNDYKGEIGTIYTLSVSINGEDYESLPIRLNEKPIVDSLYAQPVTREAYTYNASGELISEIQEGLILVADLHSEHDSTYYRFNTKVLHEIIYTDASNPMQPLNVWEWHTALLDNNYSVDQIFLNNSRYVLPEHQIGFLEYEYISNSGSVSKVNYMTYGWIATMKVYSISKSVYDYYYSIDQQLNSNNQIFSPVPAQIKSNITCLNDPGKVVIGVFEASSDTILYKGFKFDDLTKYKSIEFSYFPQNIPGGTSNTMPPDFWIVF